MAKALPKKLFVKLVQESSVEYFTADTDAASLVDMGETATIGTYQLVEISKAKGVAQFNKPRR